MISDIKFYIPLLLVSLMLIPNTDVNTRNIQDDCKKEKYKTKEPGTCLKPKALRLLKVMEVFEQIEHNPYDKKITQEFINLLEPKVYKTIDTIVEANAYNVPVRIYYPTKKTAENPTDIVLYIHGGGFMFGNIEEYDMAVKKFARISGKILVSLDYRLAPEHPFPAAVIDSKNVLKWIYENQGKLGGTGKKITVMGDSAGANIATVLTLINRDNGTDYIACQVLYYPPTTFIEKRFPSRVYFIEDETRSYFLTEEFIYRAKASYLPDSIPEDNPYLSPLEADLGGKLPPAFIITAQVDPLRDDGRFYAKKLEENGQEVKYLEYEGILHGFFNFYMIFKESITSMKLVNKFIESHV